MSHFGGAFGNGVKAFHGGTISPPPNTSTCNRPSDISPICLAKLLAPVPRPGKFFGQVVAMRHLILVCTAGADCFFLPPVYCKKRPKQRRRPIHRQGIFFVSWFLFSWIFLGKITLWLFALRWIIILFYGKFQKRYESAGAVVVVCPGDGGFYGGGFRGGWFWRLFMSPSSYSAAIARVMPSVVSIYGRDGGEINSVGAGIIVSHDAIFLPITTLSPTAKRWRWNLAAKNDISPQSPG